MKFRSTRVLAAIAAAFCVTGTGAEDATPTAAQILQRLDDVVYASRDKQVTMRFVLIDKTGRESTRDVALLEKGSQCRLMKFTAPADQKGIGFLSLPNDVMYVYLPAFGKTRRIASHVKNTKFAGTDLTYENMEAKRYSLEWDPKLIKTDAEFYYIEQTPKPNVKTEYSKLAVKIRKDNFYPVKIDYYDKQGAPCKVMTRGKIEKTGNYWESRETVMEDLKTRHKTKLLLLDAKYDIAIPDDKFTERYLMQ